MYNILEVANTHWWNIKYIFNLLEEFKSFSKSDKFGIKFQPFKYNKIATENYEWYPVYKELFFNESEWKNIFNIAFKTKDIWLDIFDSYGIFILNQNISQIYGIKLQTSILDNENIYQELQKLDLSNIILAINIAWRHKNEIEDIVVRFENLNVREVLLEVWFQAYPTTLNDSGLSKIKYLKKEFKNKIIFADHIDWQKEASTLLPLMSWIIGVEYIEKHIMHSKMDTKYDYFSSMKIWKYKKFISKQKKFFPLMKSDFLNDEEERYLKTTYQIPILLKNKDLNSLISVNSDFEFKRSNSIWMNLEELKGLVKGYHILNTKKKKWETLDKSDFKKANIAAIIACRLKSTRLPKKALLKIWKLSSIELCIKNTLKFNNLNNVILATSVNEQDKELKDYLYNDSVIFHQWDPDDVIRRYIDVIDRLNIDIIVRITGDMPYVSSEIFDFLLEKHFESWADYTVGKTAAVWTNLEIINSNALRKVKEFFPQAEYSEYMTWYFQNNPDYFDLNFVDLPKKWVRNYRLTLDYQEDLELFNKIEKHFSDNSINFSLESLYNFMDKNSEISEINSHLTLKYKTDKNLIDTLNNKTKIQ